jgi:hypothetical protein
MIDDEPEPVMGDPPTLRMLTSRVRSSKTR